VLHYLKLYGQGIDTAWSFNAGRRTYKETNWYFANGDQDHIPVMNITAFL